MLSKQFRHRLVADSNAVPSEQLRGQRVRARAHPTGRGFWIASRDGVNKPLKGRLNLGMLGIKWSFPGAPRTWTTSPGFALARPSSRPFLTVLIAIPSSSRPRRLRHNPVRPTSARALALAKDLSENVHG